MEDWGGKPDKGSIDEKLLEFNKVIWKKNQKIINIINEKIFQPRLRTGKKKPKVYDEWRDSGQGGNWLK